MSVPEIENNTVFWQVFINLEDVLDWIQIAANNGSLRRIVYSYGDLTGMEKIKPIPCRRLNLELKERLMTFFILFRENHPQRLSYHFDGPQGNAEELPGNVEDVIPPPLSDQMMNDLFNGDDVRDDNNQPILNYLHMLAHQIAEETYNTMDTSMQQLERNLVSLIGQKSVEMNMLANLCSMNSEELRKYYTDIFNLHDGVVNISRVDLTEAAELVRRSRKICLAFQEACDFEENFVKLRSKIPRTFFVRTGIQMSTVKKAMIFVLHYLITKKTSARHVKQSLKRNSSFLAFAVDMSAVLTQLTDLGLLTTERRVKRRRVVNEIRRGVNEIRMIERTDNYFKVIYNPQDERHKEFLTCYQIVYPGEVFGK